MKLKASKKLRGGGAPTIIPKKQAAKKRKLVRKTKVFFIKVDKKVLQILNQNFKFNAAKNTTTSSKKTKKK